MHHWPTQSEDPLLLRLAGADPLVSLLGAGALGTGRQQSARSRRSMNFAFSPWRSMATDSWEKTLRSGEIGSTIFRGHKVHHAGASRGGSVSFAYNAMEEMLRSCNI